MSLVNDLIIEVDRRKRQSEGPASDRLPESPVDGLAPPRRVRPPQPSRDWLRLGVLAFAVVSIGLVALWTYVPGLQPVTGSLQVSNARSSWQSGTERSAVSAASPASESVFESSASVMVRSVSLSQLGTMTRIRIATDRRGEYRIEGAGESRFIRIALADAQLAAPIAPLDLASNGLRSWQLIEQNGALVFQIEVPQAAPVQSQWIAAPGGAALFVDVASGVGIDSAPSAASADPSTALTAERTPRAAVAAAPDAWIDQPALESYESPSRDFASELAESPPASALGIARSQSDHDRTLKKDARAEAERVLNRGRFARAEGDLPAAAEFYASGLAANPGHRALTLERTRLFIEMNEPENALALIRDARREEPRDIAFALLHARLLERMGDLTSALSILDEAPFELAQAPEIYALAAAYLQRSGDHASAIQRYEALVRRFPDRSSWWMGLGISLEASSRSREAHDVYKIALELGALPEVSRSWVAGRVRALKDKG